ncbi:MAG: TatD family nuclease-associated radical SAM protein [Nanoarchaeota archaeon]|nr:TatD family nuclease-associated radical SAM protein [Nanoarchaeota archaeon]MBU1030496.1 TatD family nuclease-associated radical SAM protein [Nanoarchaeota archaeon]
MDEFIYFHKSNLYISLTNSCTNNCVFCNVNDLSQSIGANLDLKQNPKFEEIIKELDEKIHNYSFKEIVFCGVGEPLLKLDNLLKVADYINTKYFLTTRLNTNGHTYRIYKNRDVFQELKDAGVQTINVSMNATNEIDYNRICRPKLKNAFFETINFVKKCKKNNLNVKISFVDYNIDRTECVSFSKNLGVEYFFRFLSQRT